MMNTTYSKRRTLLSIAWGFVLVGCTTLAGLDDLHLQTGDVDSGVAADGSVAPDRDGRGPNGTDPRFTTPDSAPQRDASVPEDTGTKSDATVGDASPQPEAGESSDATVGDAPSDVHVVENQDGALQDVIEILLDGGDAHDDFCKVTGTCACTDKSQCRDGFDCCNNRCTDVANDKDHCSACGVACGGNKICENATCGCGGLDPFCSAECVDYFSNPDHCGKCGHSCQGGDCFGGACQPVELATEQECPSGITVDRNNVYFTNEEGNTVGRAPKQGPNCIGSACVLFTNPVLDQPLGITNDGANLYVTNYADGGVGNVVQIPTTFGPPTVLATSKGPSGIATAAGRVYWTSEDDSAMVGRVMVNGGVATAVATATAGSTDTRAIATDGISLLWGTREPRTGVPVGVFHLSATGTCTDATCSPVQTTGAGKPQSFYLFQDWLYWTSSDGTVRKMVKTGGCNAITPCPVILAQNQPDPQSVVVDQNFVYWTNAGDGSVRHTPHFQRSCNGSRCQALAGGLGTVSGLAQDGSTLYITSKSSGPLSSGVVWKLAK